MKKIIYWLSTMAIAITLGSCSNDQELDNAQINNNKGEIGFRSFIDKGSGTRATVTTTSNIRGFTVTGWWDREGKGSLGISGAATAGDEYLFNAYDITHREIGINQWEYSPKRYWPSDDIIGGGVSFFAYSPASSKNVAQGIYNYVGEPIRYTVPNNLGREEAQEDFLLARTGVLDAGRSDDKVSLNFAHTLSRVRFFARTTNTNLTYIIGDVQLVGLAMSGSIDINKIPTDGTFTYKDSDSTSDPLVLWESEGGPEDIGIDIGDSPINLRGGVNDNEYYSLQGESNALMVLPQTTELGAVIIDDEGAITGRNGFWIKVSYKAYLNNPNTGTYFAGNPTSYEDVYFQVTDELRSKSKIAPFSFEIGRSYNFYLKFGNEAGKDITFDVNVVGWNNVVPDVTP